jgi:hypothetical protein
MDCWKRTRSLAVAVIMRENEGSAKLNAPSFLLFVELVLQENRKRRPFDLRPHGR